MSHSSRRKTVQTRYESKDAPAQYDERAKLEHSTEDQMRDLDALFKSAKISESTKRRMTANIPDYALQREIRIKPYRDALQERLNEEATLMSLAKSEPGPVGEYLPHAICEKIAVCNNRTAKWDKTLAPATFPVPKETRQTRQSSAGQQSKAKGTEKFTHTLEAPPSTRFAGMANSKNRKRVSWQKRKG